MIKKTLTVVGLALVGLLVTAQTAFAADYSHLCLAAGSAEAATPSIPLASTGVGLPIGLVLLVGLVIVAAGLALIALSARKRERPAPAVTS